MNALSLRRPALLSLPRSWGTGTLTGGPARADLPHIEDPRRTFPSAAIWLGVASAAIVAATAAREIGPGFAFRDVIGLLGGYALALLLASRIPWTRLPHASLGAIVGLQILFVVSLTTMTGGGTSPYFALYAPVLALAGWHLRPALLIPLVGLVGVTEIWRAVFVDGNGGVDQVTIALPFFGALAFIAYVTGSRLSTVIVTIRRDQTQASDTLLAIQEMPGDIGDDAMHSLVAAVRRIFGCTARTVAFEPPMPGSQDLVAETAGGRRMSIAIAGASATYGVLEVERRRPFAASEGRLLGILAGAWGRALDGRRLFEQLRAASERDALTGLLNRRALDADLEAWLGTAIADGRRAAVCYIDIDGTKGVNDRDGHEAGDRAIRAVARALSAVTRDSERVYRVGGDEFVVLAVDLDPRAARDLGERLIGVQRAGRRRRGDVARPVTTISVGICHGTGPAAALLKAADRAMYQVKSAGGNGVRVVDFLAPDRAPLSSDEPAKAIEGRMAPRLTRSGDGAIRG